MTQLLLRLFVKNCGDKKAPDVHSTIGKLAGITGIVCNFILFAFKLLAGVLSGAVSIVADALNNLSDAASSVVTLLGFHMAQRPADKDHPYGHARYEYLSGVIVAVLILVIGVELAKSSVEKIMNPAPVVYSSITLIILVVSILVKLWMSIFYKKLSKMIGSTALMAASVDSRNDVITSSAVLLGCVAALIFRVNIDPYMGLGVAVFILWSGVKVAGETISPLLGERADVQLVEQLSQLVLEHDKVLGIHDLLVHDYGPGKCFASVHVELSAEESPLLCHDIIDHIECDVLEQLNVHLVIHYDPVVCDDAEWNTMRSVLETITKEIHPELSLHDFRLVRGANQKKLVFDLAVPFEMQSQYKELKLLIDEALCDRYKDYITVIRFDFI